MNIAFVVTGKGYSFTNQARALCTALEASGVQTSLQLTADTDVQQIGQLQTDLIIPVGAWQDYDTIIAPALHSGRPVLPWIVADAHVKPDTVKKLNEIPLFITTSQYCKDNFVRSGVDESRSRILYECVDEDDWQPYSDAELQLTIDLLSIDEETRTALPLSLNLRRTREEHIPILFTTGGSATDKGALEIMEALGRLPKEVEWIYLIKTWPSTKSFTEGIIELQTAEAQHIYSRIRYISGEFSGTFMKGLMNLSDIYIATSRGEGFGLPLVEAQMCGKMVITHDATATAETVINEQNGLLCTHHLMPDGEPRANIDDLAAKLHTALTDHSLRERLSGNARSSAIKRFGKKVIAEQLLQYIQELSS